jgi:hypothetical protein
MSDDGLPELEDIARHFNARSTLAIVQALERAPDARSAELAETLRSRAPSALK